jgi:hypothetical protein
MKKIVTILSLLIALPLLAQYKPQQVRAAYVNSGTGWNPWDANLGSESLPYTPQPIALYCQASAGAAWQPCNPTGGGGGGVSSVGLTAPSWLAVTGSPVTSSGTLALTPATGQTSHRVIGTCGTATTFTPCALVAADIPTLNQSTTGNAATATTLATTPTQCTGGQYATGIAASGNANCGTPAGSGTVTTVSVTTANGISGSVANATTTPAITLTLGAITPSSVAASGAVSGSSVSAGAGSTACGSATGCMASLEGSTAGTPTAANDYIRADSTSHQYKVSLNNGAEYTSLMNFSTVNLASSSAGGVSGLLPVANGGTGTASPAIVAGTNVTVSGTWPNQTINATGGGPGTGTSGTLPYWATGSTLGSSLFTDNAAGTGGWCTSYTSAGCTITLGNTSNTNGFHLQVNWNHNSSIGGPVTIVDDFGTAMFVIGSSYGATFGGPFSKVNNIVTADSGVALVVGDLSKLAQTASFAASTVVSHTGGGMPNNPGSYRLTCTLDTTSTTAGVLTALTVGYTNPNGTAVSTNILPASITLSTSALQAVPVVGFRANNTADITVATTLTGTATYNVNCVGEAFK